MNKKSKEVITSDELKKMMVKQANEIVELKKVYIRAKFFSFGAAIGTILPLFIYIFWKFALLPIIDIYNNSSNGEKLLFWGGLIGALLGVGIPQLLKIKK